ncbi:MAG TPA: nucleotide exchange factor GrpE, partial [Clostridiales bacterium]|nr:nucleotide exchange factor GrpE [Clostridiales bacterium]
MSKKKPEITETNKEEITSETVLQAESTELEKLEKELAETKDSLLRLAAEYDNFRKRTAKEKLQAHGDAKASVLVELLPVLDNFDRALDKGVSDSEAFQKGIEMTYNQLV